MWKIEKQVADDAGTHRWESAGSKRYVTLNEAERARERAARAFLKAPTYAGLRCARFRVALAAIAACLVLQ